MAKGLPTQTPLSLKLWRASRILNKSPFEESLLAHNEAQLDFIIEMYAKDNPRELKFMRVGEVDDSIARTTALRDWANVLIGPALTNYLASKLPSANVLNVLRRGAGIIEMPKRPGSK